MRRKKLTKKKRQELNQIPHGKFGGYMPEPPEDCNATRIYDDDEREYIDITNCAKCAYKPKCQRRNEYEKEWKEWKKKYREYKGINTD